MSRPTPVPAQGSGGAGRMHVAIWSRGVLVVLAAFFLAILLAQQHMTKPAPIDPLFRWRLYTLDGKPAHLENLAPARETSELPGQEGRQ